MLLHMRYCVCACQVEQHSAMLLHMGCYAKVLQVHSIVCAGRVEQHSAMLPLSTWTCKKHKKNKNTLQVRQADKSPRARAKPQYFAA